MSIWNILIDRRRLLTNMGQTALVVGVADIARSAAASGALPGADASAREVCESYWRAESSRDLELTLKHFKPNAVFMAAGTEYRGVDQIRTFFAQNFHDFPRLEVSPVHVISSGPEAALEWHAVITARSGEQQKVIGINVLRIEAGRIAELHGYFDPTILSRK
jgi:uncharacterized protein (TIGR02246 family)